MNLAGKLKDISDWIQNLFFIIKMSIFAQIFLSEYEGQIDRG